MIDLSNLENYTIQTITDLEWPSILPDYFIRGSSFPITKQQIDQMELNYTFQNFKNSNLMKQEDFLQLDNSLQYWAVILLICPIFTVFGNVLVVLSVFKDQNLHTATNYFIVSLAIADISLAVFVMPLASWVEANNGRWSYGSTFCDIFIMFDVLLCTASILNLAAISIDRYVAVTKPIFYAQHSKNIRVGITIGLTWLLSFLIALPIACGLNNLSYRNQELCVMYTPEYIIASSIGSFYIPCLIMIILYYQVFNAIRSRTKRSKQICSYNSVKNIIYHKNNYKKNNINNDNNNNNNNHDNNFSIEWTENIYNNNATNNFAQIDQKMNKNVNFTNPPITNSDSYNNNTNNHESDLNNLKYSIIHCNSLTACEPIRTDYTQISNLVDTISIDENQNIQLSLNKESNSKDYSKTQFLIDQSKITETNNSLIIANINNNPSTKLMKDFNFVTDQNCNKNMIKLNNQPNLTETIDNNHTTIKQTTEFNNMDDFRKHLRKRIKKAKRSSISMLTPTFSGLSCKQMFALQTYESKQNKISRFKLKSNKFYLNKTGNSFEHQNDLIQVNNINTTTTNNNVKSSMNQLYVKDKLKFVSVKFKKQNFEKFSDQNNDNLQNNDSQTSNCSHLLSLKSNHQGSNITLKENLAAKREKKATKTLAIVLGVFLICWMPFFTVNIIQAFCFKYQTMISYWKLCNMPKCLTSICVWLGYINSFLNPIIYTIFNVEFRKAFKKLLNC